MTSPVKKQKNKSSPRVSFVLNIALRGEPLVQDLDMWIDAVSSGLDTRIPYAGSQEIRPGMVMHVWQEKEGKGTLLIRVVEDDAVLGVVYLTIDETEEGEDEDRPERAGKMLSEDIPVIPLPELKEQARQNLKAHQSSGAIQRLAMGTYGPEEDGETVEIFKKALQDENIEIRRDAISAMGVVKWSCFLEPLQAILEQEKDDVTYEMLEYAVKRIQEESSGE